MPRHKDSDLRLSFPTGSMVLHSPSILVCSSRKLLVSFFSAAHMDLFKEAEGVSDFFLFQSEFFFALQVKFGAYLWDRVSFPELTESDTERSMILQKLRIAVCLNFP